MQSPWPRMKRFTGLLNLYCIVVISDLYQRDLVFFRNQGLFTEILIVKEQEWKMLGTSLAVQCFKTLKFHCREWGSIPVQGTKIPCAMLCGQKKRMENASSRYKRWTKQGSKGSYSRGSLRSLISLKCKYCV